MTTLYLVVLNEVPIFQQLQLEEALLRAGKDNYFLINQKSTPAIVMGISGKVEELVDPEHFSKRPIPIIRRFSGGGCVLIEEDTLFLSLIFNRKDQDIGTCPRRLLSYTEELLKPAFNDIAFEVRENDYVIGDKKFGGNAQYFTKDRWLHHSSLLWDFCKEKMRILKMPPKIPEYRNKREHGDFLTSLNRHFDTQEAFLTEIKKALSKRFNVVYKSFEDMRHIIDMPHRKATEQVLFPTKI